ncbi:MAG: trigger factor [Anaerolineales bacterium]|nr:trigger factor [Anaerolineales bacterium]
MKIEKKVLDDHQLELVVETDQDSFDKAKYLAAKELSKDKKIPGYRPGKAPYKLIVNHFGEGAIIDQALENYLDEIYPQILDEVEQEPYGPGQLKEVTSLEPPVFEFVIPLQPEVDLGKYQDIRIAYESSEVTDSDVDEVVKQIVSQQAVIEEVDHPAEETNIVDTSLSGRLAEAEPDDEDAQIMINQPLPVMVKTTEEDDSKEWPFPGFSRQLLGASPGDFLELTYTHDDREDISEEIRGKEVLYTVNIEGIRERVLPEVNDELVKEISEFETVEQLLEEIRTDLEAKSLQDDNNEYLNQIFDEILNDATVKFPPQMLENEVNGEIQELGQRLQSQGMELEMYLEMQEMSEDDLRDQIRPQAKKRIERGLILGKIADSEDLDIKPEEITGQYQQILDDHFGEEDSEERKNFMASGESMNLLNQVSSQMISQRTMDYLIALAKGEDATEYLKQEEEPAEEESENEEPSETEDLSQGHENIQEEDEDSEASEN